MRTYFVLFFSLNLIHLSFAQVTQRNILANKYNLLAVQQSLVPKNQWKPYPLPRPKNGAKNSPIPSSTN